MKKSLRLILTAAATLLAVLALVFYTMNGAVMTSVRTMNIAAIVLGAIYVALYGKLGEKDIFSFLISAAAVLILGAFAYSLITEVEILGYLISGLRQWSDVQNWAYFSAAAIVSWLLLLVASFLQPKKNA